MPYPKYKLLILSDYDSRIKYAATIAQKFQENCNIDFFIRDKNHSEYQSYFKKNMNIYSYHTIWDVIETNVLFHYHIIIISLGGGENLKVIHYIKENISDRNRPFIISGFNGILDPYDIHGLLFRYGSDYICLNSNNNLEHFSASLTQLNLSTKSLYNIGYQRHFYKKEEISQLIQNVIFIEQENAPPHIAQKKDFINNIIKYAQKYTDRNIIIQIRKNNFINRGRNQNTFYSLCKRYIPKEIENIQYSFSDIERMLYKADLCIAFTSTALIESLIIGTKAAILIDYGIGTHIGNHVYSGSNLFVTMNDILEDKIPNVSDEWKMKNCFANENEIYNIRNEIFSKIKNNILPRDIEIFYTKERFPFFYKKNKKLLFIILKKFAIFKFKIKKLWYNL